MKLFEHLERVNIDGFSPSDVWTSLLICATLPGHPVPSLLQLQGGQKQECEGVSILRIAIYRAIFNTQMQVCQVDDVLDHLRILYRI